MAEGSGAENKRILLWHRTLQGLRSSEPGTKLQMQVVQCGCLISEGQENILGFSSPRVPESIPQCSQKLTSAHKALVLRLWKYLERLKSPSCLQAVDCYLNEV